MTDIPEHVEPKIEDARVLEEFPDFAVCADCRCRLRLIVWGEGIDSEIECTNPECDNKTGYR